MEHNIPSEGVRTEDATLGNGASPERKNEFKEIVTFALIALIVVIPIRLFIAEPFLVNGPSMESTFQSGDYLIADQLTYDFEAPKRGDVIIMRYPKDPAIFFIKRIIGLPGETVELSGTNVIIHPANGGQPFTLDESFIDPSRIENQHASYTLGATDYFVMGDNRVDSSDSRVWGPLPRQDIIGHVIVRLYPFTHIGIAPGAVTLQQ
jgi:signal peptidase I